MPQGTSPSLVSNASTNAPILLAITGGTGFVGACVIREALSAGHRVRALIRNPAKRLDLEHENLTWHKGALGDDDAAFVQGADCVIHIAGLIKARNRAEFDAVNVDAAKNIAVAASAANVPRFVHLSSMTARHPGFSDYSGSKHAGEMAVKDTFKGNLAVIRAPAVFGPGDEATAPFFKAIKRGILPAPGGKGWKTRCVSIAFVDDLARDVVLRAVTGAYDGKTVSPASILRITWPEFAALFSKARGKVVRPVPLPLSALYPVAAITSITSQMLGLGHLTLGKLNEFLYQDWSSDDAIQDATPPEDALRATLRYYKAL